MNNIKKITACEILDSRGYPTIEATLELEAGCTVTTSIPSGTSLSKFEAVELRDSNAERFGGKGVAQAVYYINNLIGPKLIGISPLKQAEIDDWLIKADGTKNKSKLGANTILTISQLVAKAGALASKVPLYRYLNTYFANKSQTKIAIEKISTPIFSLINGGKHANNNLDFQEFEIIPSSSFSFSESLQIVSEIFYELKEVLIFRGANISVGEEGGFTPNFATNLDGLEILKETVNRKKLKLGMDVFLGLDIAASHFYQHERYLLREKPQAMRLNDYLNFIDKIINTYSLLILEDPISEDDWEGWKNLFQKIKKEIYLVGDDFIGSNKDRLLRAVKEKACSSVVIKPNQIGTITETLEIADLAQKNDLSIIISHRSSETNDDFIADLSVALQADFVKFGAPSRGERVAKYNRLWAIERQEKLG